MTEPSELRGATVDLSAEEVRQIRNSLIEDSYQFSRGYAQEPAVLVELKERFIALCGGYD